ncbi:MAG: virginiamycin lyase [Acidimicrobiaceae bacterium]
MPASDEIFNRVVREGRRRRGRALAIGATTALALVIGGLVIVTRSGPSRSLSVSVSGTGSDPTTTTTGDKPVVPDPSLSSTTLESTTTTSPTTPPTCGAGVTAYAAGTTSLGRLTVGSDGRVWFTSAPTATVGAVDLLGTVSTYHVPAAPSNAYLPALDADGNVWFAEWGTATVHIVTPSGLFFSSSFAENVNAMTHGADGELWYAYADSSGEGIASHRSDGTDPHQLVQPSSQGYAGLVDVEAGSDGTIWFAESAINKIGVIKDGVVREFDGPANRQGANAGPDVIAAAADGVWFLAPNADGTRLLGHLHADGSISDTQRLAAFDIAVGPDGTVWFTTNANSLGAVQPDGNVISYETQTATQFVIIGPDGNPWFTTGNEVGTIRPRSCGAP